MTSSREIAGNVANRAREDLLITLKELDRRREAAMDVRAQLLKHQTLIIAAGAVVGVAVVGSITFAVLHSRSEQRRLPRTRVQGLLRAWQHPDRLARKRPPMGPTVLTQVMKTAAGIATARLLQWAFDQARTATLEVRPTRALTAR